MKVIRQLVLLVASVSRGSDEDRIAWGRGMVGGVIMFNVMTLGFATDHDIITSLSEELARSLGDVTLAKSLERLSVVLLLIGSGIATSLWSLDVSPATSRGSCGEIVLYGAWGMTCTFGQFVVGMYSGNFYLSLPTTVVATAIYLYAGTRLMERTIAREAAEKPAAEQ